MAEPAGAAGKPITGDARGLPAAPEWSGVQLALLGVVLVLVLVANDRAPEFVRYTLLLILAYLALAHAAPALRAGESLVGALAAATRGG